MMSVVSLIVKSLLILITTHLAWRVVRRVLRKSPLDNLPGPHSAPWFMGHIPQWLDRHGAEFQRQIAQDYGPVVKMQGMMGKPALYIYDPRALYTMLVKQPTIYDEEELFIKINSLLFGPGLISVVGDQHRKQRKILNPAFSAAHMRNMLPTFYDIADRLRDAFTQRVGDAPQELDILNWMSRTALEFIAQGGIGVSVDPLTRDTTDEYSQAVKELVPTLYGLGALRLVLAIPGISQLGPAWLRRRFVEMTPHKGLQKMTRIVDSLARKSVRIFEEKKAELRREGSETSKQISEGKDILNLMMRANMDASEADKLSEEELIAQMSLFLFAATDTTSNSTVKVLERLTQNEDIQLKLRKELIDAQRDGRPSYEELMRLPILDAVVRETLRTDPLANLVTRQPIKDVVLPLSSPIRGRDGTLMSEIPIPKGTEIIMGVLGHNTNTALWGPDANEWKPERWLAPLPDALTEAPAPGVYANLMTFLGGGRSCIGFKFSELEMKVILSVVLSTFKFEMSDKPIVWNVASVRYPTVGRESNVPQMPMKVSLL